MSVLSSGKDHHITSTMVQLPSKVDLLILIFSFFQQPIVADNWTGPKGGGLPERPGSDIDIAQGAPHILKAQRCIDDILGPFEECNQLLYK